MQEQILERITIICGESVMLYSVDGQRWFFDKAVSSAGSGAGENLSVRSDIEQALRKREQGIRNTELGPAGKSWKNER